MSRGIKRSEFEMLEMRDGKVYQSPEQQLKLREQQLCGTLQTLFLSTFKQSWIPTMNGIYETAGPGGYYVENGFAKNITLFSNHSSHTKAFLNGLSRALKDGDVFAFFNLIDVQSEIQRRNGKMVDQGVLDKLVTGDFKPFRDEFYKLAPAVSYRQSMNP